MLKRICLTMLSGVLLLLGAAPTWTVTAEHAVRVTPVDGVNVTRWDNLLVVYKGIPTTGQNEWGHNVVVDASGRVVRIIPGGDLAGKDLAIPEGGMVVSATGNKTGWLLENIKESDFVRFDEVTGRVMVSETDSFDVCFSESMRITASNDVRYAEYVVLYDRSLQKTGTNGYGYEIGVDANGVVVFSGGNDSTVPENGFVLSVIEPEDKLFLKTYGVVGATCTLAKDRKSFTLTYTQTEIKRSTEMQVKELEQALSEAEDACLLIDTALAQAALEEVKAYLSAKDLTKLENRTEAYALLDRARLSLCEQKRVETRGIWYVPLERSEEAIRHTVSEMQRCGINQLCLGLGGTRTITPVPEGHPFRQNTIYRDLDLLGIYSDACKQAGIELVVSLSVFCDSGAKAHKSWMTVATAENAPEADIFYSPACEEYFDAFSSYVEFLLDTYALDGIQLDYIRYPYFDGTVDYGYDQAAKQLFAAYAGVDASVVDEIAVQLRNHPLWSKWVDFKQSLITDWVKRLEQVVHRKHPQVQYSVCLAADTFPESYFQDGKGWVEAGLVDAVYPMSYAEGIMPSQAAYFSSFDGEYFCIEGSGSYLSLSKQEQLLQVEQARQYGADGICFFEWGAYLAHGYDAYLQEGVFKQKAVSPTYDTTLAVQTCIEQAKERLQRANERDHLTDTQLQTALEALDAYSESGRKTMHDLLAAYSEQAWCKQVLKELALADKIGQLALKREQRPIEEASEASESSEESEETTSAPSVDETEASTPGKSERAAGLWIGIGIGIAAICGGAIALLLRKKKNER